MPRRCDAQIGDQADRMVNAFELAASSSRERSPFGALAGGARRRVPLSHWHTGPKRRTIRLLPDEVTGHRIVRHADRSLHDLPSVAERTGRAVRIPPTRARAEAR